MAEFKPIFDGQHEDEEVLMVFHRHPVVMRKGLLALLIIMVFGMIPSLIWPTNLNMLWFALLGLGIGSIFMFFSWISWHYSIFIVTDQRLIQITQKGLFNRSVVDIGLDKIQNINYQINGFQETVLGFGTILVQTFVGDLVMDYIHHPQAVQEKIVKIIKELGYSSFRVMGDPEEEQE